MKYKEVMIKLRRMKELKATIDRDYEIMDAAEASDIEEWITIKDEVMPAAKKLLERMVAAGLLTVSVDIDNDLIEEIWKRNYRSINLDVKNVFENGNFWLQAGEVSGGTIGTTPLPIPTSGNPDDQW